MRRAALAAVAYLLVFAVLLWPWVINASHATAAGDDFRDRRLILWILAWVFQALHRQPSGLFDAPIFFPAPLQLTGSEHLLASQVLFAPVFWATGNVLLAANSVAILSYPLAAIAMERFLVALGARAVAAWVGGLAFALGPLCLSPTVHVLQYLVLFLPLCCLALLRLRRVPSVSRAAVFGSLLLLGFLSSYYMAAILCVTVGLWGLVLAAEGRPARSRFVVLAGLSAGVAVVALARVSAPYFERKASLESLRPERATTVAAAATGVAETDQITELLRSAKRVQFLETVGRDPLLPLLAAVGVVASVRRSSSMRRAALAGLCWAGVGSLFGLGALDAVIARAGFLRSGWRFVALYGFGVATLASVALQNVTAWWGRRAGAACGAASIAALLCLEGRWLRSVPIEEVAAVSADAPVYRAVGRLTRGGGALLELPWTSPRVKAPGRDDLQSEAMVGATIHGRPLVGGFTGVLPVHDPLIRGLVAGLPNGSALDDLADMTHLRWILVRPARDWPSPRARQRFVAALRTVAGVGPPLQLGGWTLYRIDRQPRHPQWFKALSRLPAARHSLLGTPLARIPEAAAKAELRLGGAVSPARASGLAMIPVVVTNSGSAGWPVATVDGIHARGAVYLVASWRRAGAAPDEPPVRTGEVALRRDVPPHEAVSLPVLLLAPPAPGDYDLDLSLRQRGGEAFSGARSHALRVRVEVVEGPKRNPPASDP